MRRNVRDGLRAMVAAWLLVGTAATQGKESLLIGPGDLVHVQVFDTPELEQSTRVSDAGDLLLTMGGSLHVAGLTAEGAAHQVEARLRERMYLLNPHVLIGVEQFATQRVAVYGEVRSPGVFAINTVQPITSVLAQAGGLTELADRHVVVERHGTSEKIPYFLTNRPQEQAGPSLTIEPGDVVFVPKASVVYILGDVKLPGGYTMTTNDSTLSVLQLVARSGGTNNTATVSHTRLIRKTPTGTYVEMSLPLGDMRKGKKPDEQLRPDDVIYVPFSYLRNFAILGANSVPSALTSAVVYRF